MSYVNIFVFLVGLVSTIKVKFGGDLFATDLALAAALPFLIGRGRAPVFKGAAAVILAAGLLWLFNQIITDIYRETPFDDWSRGWAKISFFLSDFCALLLLLELRFDRILALISGAACALILATLFYPNDFQIEVGGDFAGGPWKFGFAPGLTTLAAIFGATAISRRMLGVVGEFVPLALLGIVNLAFNYRSMFAFAFAAASFGLLRRVVAARRDLRARITPISFGLLLGVGVVFAQGLTGIYSSAAENGWLGLDAKQKYEIQTSGTLNLLQSGRVEFLVSTQAIADAPILGHGSWARDMRYASLLVAILESNGAKSPGDPYSTDLIPTHSHLLGAWVEAGVMGGAFWAIVLTLAVVALYYSLKIAELPGTFVAFILIGLIWDIAFSPFGAEQRFAKAAQICVALSVLDRSNGGERITRRRFASALE